jgi:hypothetical protein
MSTINTSAETFRRLMESVEKAIRGEQLQTAESQLLQAYELGLELFGRDHGAVGLVLLRLAEVAHKTGRVELGREYHLEVDRIVDQYLRNADAS